MRLEGKVVIITGAGSGIGRETAKLFSQEGAHIVVAEYRIEKGKETLDMVKRLGGEGIFVEVDVSNSQVVSGMVNTAVKTYGHVDILFNNAGTLFFGTILETDEATWNSVISVNLTGAYLCSRAVLPVMIKKGGGSIINMSSSTGAHDAAGNSAAYIASKGGVALLTKAMAIDHAKNNIRVNAIAPGPTDTSMLKDNIEADKIKAFVENTVPLERLGRPSEIASVALFLASDESSFVTGAVIPVDGGQTAHI